MLASRPPKHVMGEPVNDDKAAKASNPPELVTVPEVPRRAQSGPIRDLLELVAALDRRVPQVQRAGEASIARDAAALRARALKRIEELQRQQRASDES